MSNKKQERRFSLRLQPNQELVIEEAAKALNTPKSVLIRAIIGDWLKKNEDCIYRLIDNKLDLTTEEEDE